MLRVCQYEGTDEWPALDLQLFILLSPWLLLLLLSRMLTTALAAIAPSHSLIDAITGTDFIHYFFSFPLSVCFPEFPTDLIEYLDLLLFSRRFSPPAEIAERQSADLVLLMS